jgi:hypothetical protein
MGIIKGKHGGARPGAGRKRGSIDRVTINGLLETLEHKTNNRPYEELLIEDFLDARNRKDSLLVLKYHTLFMSKLMNNLTKVEFNDTTHSLEAKHLAFQEALDKLIQKPL